MLRRTSGLQLALVRPVARLWDASARKRKPRLPATASMLYASSSVPLRQSAVVVDAERCPGLGPSSLVLVLEQDVPECAAGEVLIEVAFAGVNRPDVMQRKNLYPPPRGHSRTLGLEVSGTIVQAGANVTGLSIGQQVCALTPGGGYSQYCVAPQECVLPIPHEMSLRDAAALPEALFTVYYNVFMKAQLRRGQILLVHGGAGGIGTTAIQVAKALGAVVFTTAGSEEKCALCEELGADLAVNYSTHDFVAVIKEQLGKGRGVDVVLDMVGGEYIDRNLKLLTTGGRHVSIAFQQGSKVAVDLTPVLTRSVTLMGSTMRPRTVREKGAIAGELLKHVWPLLGLTGGIRPVVHQTLPLSQASEAHRLLEGGHVHGKLVLQVRDRDLS